MWLITNHVISEFNKLNKSTAFNFYSNEDYFEDLQQGMIILTQGYISLRNNYLIPEYITDIVPYLYKKYGLEFINMIKGNFIIVLILEDRFHIFSDRFAIRKYFIWNNKNHFIIGDNLHHISNQVKLKPSRLSMMIYSLTYHFTGRYTLFENLEHNEPADHITLINNRIQKKNYWDPNELLARNQKNLVIGEISDTLKHNIEQTVSTTKSISLSLTGGGDTRNLLAVFLSLGIEPHVYTYGNPSSIDCIRAADIARDLSLNHQIYDIKMSAQLFEDYARKIIRIGGGLSSIHRVHRLIAIEKESEFATYMYLGTLGGEFIKGVSEDDYIMPRIVFDNWNSHFLTNEQLNNYLRKKRIQTKNPQIEELNAFFSEQEYMQKGIEHRKLQALSRITASLHDAQDINLYRSVMNEVFTPFLDIDYLELLFSSGYSFDKKESIKNNYYRKIQNPVFAAQFLKNTFPKLLRYKYSGEHIPSEVLKNKYYAAVQKKIRKLTARTYPANFPLTDWMETFVRNNLSKCKEYDIIKETFDIDQLYDDLNTEELVPAESYWLKYTNPIQMRYIIDEFANA